MPDEDEQLVPAGARPTAHRGGGGLLVPPCRLMKAGVIPKTHERLVSRVSAWAELVGYVGSIALSADKALALQAQAGWLQGAAPCQAGLLACTAAHHARVCPPRVAMRRGTVAAPAQASPAGGGPCAGAAGADAAGQAAHSQS